MDFITTGIIPLFLIIILGFAANRFRLLPAETGDVLCSFLYNVCAPASFFISIINSDLKSIFSPRLALCFFLAEMFSAAIFALYYSCVRGLSGKSLIMHTIQSFYGNLAYVGIPVFTITIGDITPLVLATLIHSVWTFPITVFLLDSENDKSTKFSPKKVLLLAVRNPAIPVCLLATILLILQIRLPQFLVKAIDMVGQPTTACSLFALGFTCYKGDGTETYTRPVILDALGVALGKIIVSPAIAYLIGRFLIHMTGIELQISTMIFLLPIALNCFVVSRQFDTEVQTSQLAILFSTLFFPLTLSLYLMFL